MPRAYCLSCNELVAVTAASTCPEGHPVSLESHGPEPWVGFAESTRTDAVGRAPTRMAGGTTTVNGHPGINGHGGGVNGNGHHAGGSTSVDVADLPSGRPGRGGISATGGFEEQADELAALLSEALSEQTPEEAGSPAPPVDDAPLFPAAPQEPAVDAPVERRSEPEDVERRSEPEDVERGSERGADDLFEDLLPTPRADEPTPTGTESWDDLASLAAELQLGDEVASRPTDVAPPVAPPDEPAYDLDGDEAFDLDGALAALQSSLGDPPSPSASPVDAPSVREVADLPPPPPPAAESPAAESPAAMAPPPPPPPPPPAPTPPPAVAAFDEAVGFAGPSEAPDPVAFLEELPPAPSEAPPTEPRPALDPVNFTARGARVGAHGPPKKRRKR